MGYTQQYNFNLPNHGLEIKDNYVLTGPMAKETDDTLLL